jgi:tetratricopeptide (TPR) repeat protein
MRKLIKGFYGMFLCAALIMGLPAQAQESLTPYEELCRQAVEAAGKKDFALAQQKSLKAIELNPNGQEAYYNLFVVQYYQGQIDESVKNYTKAVELGYSVPQAVQAIMAGYKYQELTVNLPGRPDLPLKGSTGCSQKLITDVLNEFTKSVEKAENLVEVRPKFLQWLGGFKQWKEEWVVKTKQREIVLLITFTPSPGGGTDYEIALK